MMDVPENGSMWVSGAAVVISAMSLFRDRGKDAEKKIKDITDPIAKALEGHKADYGLFKTGVDDTMRNHVVYRRDFEDYKRDQTRTLERLEEGLRREFTDMREILGKIMDRLMKQGPHQ